MDSRLTGSTAYVTGGAQGIGAAVVQRLVSEGVRVAVSDRDEEALMAHRDEWTDGGHEPVLIVADLGTADGAVRAAEQAVDRLGECPNLLVNNVGVAMSTPFSELTDDGWQACFELNFMSHVRACRVLLPRMREKPGAAVVNVASDLAKQPEPVPVDYGSMKTALLYLSKALAIEHAPQVRINAVLPGPVWTGLWSRPGGVVDRLADIYGTDRDEALKIYLKERQMPLGIADPDDVATMVTYLLSPLASHVNGSAFDIGGTIRGLL